MEKSLSLSNIAVLKTKVNLSGVGALVEEIVVTEDVSKVLAAEDILKKAGNAEDIIFIDDNPYRALHSVKEKFPHIRTIQLIRPELETIRERHSGCDHDCRTLDEIQKLL